MKIITKAIGFGLNMASLLAPKWATRQLIRLFGTPPKPEIRPKDRDFLATARQQLMQRGNHQIMEYHWGPTDGPLIILSYGWAYNAGRWRYFVPTMVERGYRVIAYDPCGHGMSSEGMLDLPTNASFVRAIIHENGQPEALIAHSFGGGSSIHALHELPANLHPKRMVIMASFSSAPAIFRDYANALGLWPWVSRKLVSTFEQKIRRSLQSFDMARMTADFTHIEGLLVHNPHDTVTPYSNAIRYHSHWKGSHLLSPLEGHHHLGTPAITQAVVDFATLGTIPADAETQQRPLNTNHDLARFFAGV
jgi:hypothetical protein